MKANVGQLRQRVIIQQVSESSDSTGGYTPTWSTLATVWADIRPISANELMRYGQLETPVTHVVIIRYQSGLGDLATRRISWGSRTFNITSYMDIDERNRLIRLLCEEHVAT